MNFIVSVPTSSGPDRDRLEPSTICHLRLDAVVVTGQVRRRRRVQRARAVGAGGRRNLVGVDTGLVEHLSVAELVLVVLSYKNNGSTKKICGTNDYFANSQRSVTTLIIGGPGVRAGLRTSLVRQGLRSNDFVSAAVHQ
jgi:hypothetical protein